ncbi:MAG: CAP domain-containing protein [Pseudomonadota bacterium]
MTIATEYERYMLGLINQERAAIGAPPLQLEQNLNLSADRHSAWMLEEDIFDHTGVDGSSATERMRDAGFDFSGSWSSAENIAVQSERGAEGIMDDVANLHTSLMNSPGHRANILNPSLEYIGIGIALGDFDFESGTYESVIVTQNFAATGGTVDLDLGVELDEEPVAEPVFAAAEQPVEIAQPAPQEPEQTPTSPATETNAPVANADAPAIETNTPDTETIVPAIETNAPESVPTDDIWICLASQQLLEFFDTMFDDTTAGPSEQEPEANLQTMFFDAFRQRLETLADLNTEGQADDFLF